MPRVQLPIAGPRAVDRSWAVNAQRAINLYPEVEGDGAAAVLTMKPTPGFVLIATEGAGPCRSDFVTFGTSAYVVSEASLLQVTSGLTINVIGTLNTSVGNVSMVAGRDYIMLVDGIDGYYWDGTTFSAITVAGGFPTNPTYCGYLDGYFMVNDTTAATSDQWNISDLEDPRTWPALDFSSADSNPDGIVAIMTSYRDIYMIGDKTTEVYFNSGNADFPFELYSNGVLEFGTPAPFSVARTGGLLFMLSQGNDSSPSVIMVNGFQAQKIADPDLAYTISRMSVVEDARGFAYTMADQTFYEITFPQEDITFVYHLEQDMWHERSSSGIGRHRVQGYGYSNTRHLVGDYDNGNIYYLAPEVYTENGDTITRTRVGAVVQREGRQFEVNELEVEFKRGVGITSGQGSDPEVMMRYSPDGGNSWSSELIGKLGAIGEYEQRAIWHQLGQMEKFTVEVRVTDPVEVIINNASMEVELLDA